MGEGEAGEVTRLLVRWRDGDAAAFERLLPLVYDELRVIAGRQLRRERPDHTLQTTALVHEAYLRLVGSDVSWEGRPHFLAVAATCMRRILVDHARARGRQKRDPGQRVPSPAEGPERLPLDSLDLIALDTAMEKLMGVDHRKGRALELYYFGGLSYEEMAPLLAISPATVHRELRSARAWLSKELDTA